MIFILNRNEEVIGVLTNNGSPDSCPYYDDIFTEDLDTGSTTYEFKVPAKHENSSLLSEGNYIVRKDLDGTLVMFTIMEATETHAQIGEKHVYCEGAGLELINDIVRPNQLDSVNAQTFMEFVLQETRWEVGHVEYVGIESFVFEDYKSVLETLQDGAHVYGGELQFRVTMTNGVVTHRYVDLLYKRGNDTKKRFVFNKDITSIERVVDMTDVATALIGVGSDGIDFKSIGYYISNGDPFTKPLNQDWVGDSKALEQFGTQGKHLFGTFSYETNEPLLLLQKTYQELQRRKVPYVTYNVDVALLERLAGYENEKVRIGDTVYIIDETFNPPLYLEARVRTLETSFSDPMKDKCTLGNYKEVKSNITAQMREVQYTLLKKESTWDSASGNAQQAIDTADNAQKIAEGANENAQNALDMIDHISITRPAITYASLMPITPATNDIWYKTDPTNETLIIGVYIWDGTQWVEQKLDAMTFSVGQLSAITSNLGEVTAGNISGVSIDIGGKFMVDSAGNFTATNAIITGGQMVGGSINISTDLHVGNNIYVGEYSDLNSTKHVYFNSKSNIECVNTSTLNGLSVSTDVFSIWLNTGSNQDNFYMDEGQLSLSSSSELGLYANNMLRVEATNIDFTGNFYVGHSFIGYDSGSTFIDLNWQYDGHTRIASDNSNGYLYIQADNDIRFTNYKSGTLRPVYAGAFNTSNTFIGTSSIGVGGLFNGSSSTSNVSIGSSNIYVPNKVYAGGVALTSDRNRKKNIVEFTKPVWDDIKELTPYQYNLDTELDNELPHLGIILQESPIEIIDPEGAVEGYAFTTFLLKGLKEAIARIEALENQLKGE